MKIINVKDIVNKAVNLNKEHILWVVVKNDCYNLGLEQICMNLIENQIDHFCVISLDEAITLRNLSKDIEILLLGLIPFERLEDVINYNIIVSINEMSDLEKIDDRVRRFYKLNTNLNRFGLSMAEAKDIDGFFYSHLSVVDDEVIDDYFSHGFDMIGSSKFLKGKNIRVGFELFKDAVSVIEPIAYIRRVSANSHIGYDYYTFCDVLVGIINMGYIDGLTINNKNRLVYINGNYYPILSIGMNHCFIGIDDNIKLGDMVEIIGEHIKLCDVANKINTSPYEVLTLLDKKCRKYV